MNATDLWPALVALLLALATSHWMSPDPLPQDSASRYASIDGLRGYLAFGVFMHHAVIWQSYRASGSWAASPSAFYVNAGKGSVALFFMITAFLFYGRLLEARQRPFDWPRLFLGRVLRLAPAYLVMVAVLLSVVAVQTGGRLQVELPTLLRSLLDWLLFTIPGPSDVNGLARTQLIVSGVTWTLPYEWMFYAALPLLVLLTGRRPSLGALLVTAVFVLALRTWRPGLANLAPFAVGIGAAYAARWQPLQRWAQTPVASACTVVCLIGGFGLSLSALSPLPQVFQALAFVMIASGNDVFGVLSSRVSRRFGEPTYSLYLLHGLVLFIGFRWVIGPSAAGMSPGQHWVALWVMTPVAVALSHLCHRYVELPGMVLTDPLLRRWRAGRFLRGRASQPPVQASDEPSAAGSAADASPPVTATAEATQPRI